MIAALYVQRNGAYYGLPDVDPWDEQRDARMYTGPHPIVAHPPCQRWCQLAGLVESRYGYKKGDDGDCFTYALAAVRRWGGVLEHPAYSHAWAAFGLPRPDSKGGWAGPDPFGGWSCHVEQHRYGHRARKATWLYACHTARPDLIWGKDTSKVTHQISEFDQTRMRRLGLRAMNKKEKIATPQAFRDLLLSMARSARDPLTPHTRGA